jgi:hypothetical protein
VFWVEEHLEEARKFDLGRRESGVGRDLFGGAPPALRCLHHVNELACIHGPFVRADIGIHLGIIFRRAPLSSI